MSKNELLIKWSDFRIEYITCYRILGLLSIIVMLYVLYVLFINQNSFQNFDESKIENYKWLVTSIIIVLLSGLYVLDAPHREAIKYRRSAKSSLNSIIRTNNTVLNKFYYSDKIEEKTIKNFNNEMYIEIKKDVFSVSNINLNYQKEYLDSFKIENMPVEGKNTRIEIQAAIEKNIELYNSLNEFYSNLPIPQIESKEEFNTANFYYAPSALNNSMLFNLETMNIDLKMLLMYLERNQYLDESNAIDDKFREKYQHLLEE